MFGIIFQLFMMIFFLFILGIFSVFSVKCPKGMFYDSSTNTCKNCAVGYISTSEGSLQCQACPANSSTLVEGSKTCTGNL